MGNKITDMTPLSPPLGTELFVVDEGTGPKSMTVDVLKQFVIDAIEAIAAASSVTGADSVFMLQGGAMKPADIDLIAQHAIDTVWGKTAETAPDGADILALHDGGVTEKTVTLALVAEYVRATVEAAILDVSDLSDGVGTIATTDYMLVTQGTTGKRIQISDLSTLIYASLATHVTGLTGTVTGVGTDELYFVRGGSGDKMTLAELATFVNASATLSGSGTADYLAKWTSGTALAAGYTVAASAAGFDAGADTEVATTKAIRAELDEVQKRYQTFWVPASRMSPTTTNGAAAVATYEFATNGIQYEYMAFAGAGQDEHAVFPVAMPDNWDRGPIKFKVFWTDDKSANTASVADDVSFYLAAGALSDGDAIDAALGTLQAVVDALTAKADLHVSPASAGVTVGGTPALGDLTFFKLSRDFDYGGTPMAEDAWVSGIQIQYLEDAIPAVW